MAIYHCSVSAISRSAGRTATGAAAYRTGSVIRDERTELTFDYTRKQGVESKVMVLPDDYPAWASDRSALWNAAERAELRKNAQVAREFVVALPDGLTKEGRKDLAVRFTQELVERYGFAAEVAIHAPHRKGDQRNWHAHILCSTRRLTPEGFGEKTRELDDRKLGSQEIEHCRGRWAALVNDVLDKAKRPERVDHRSHRRRSLDAIPTVHEGPMVRAMARRGVLLERAALNAEISKLNSDLRRAKKEATIQKAAGWFMQNGYPNPLTNTRYKDKPMLAVMDTKQAAGNVRLAETAKDMWIKAGQIIRDYFAAIRRRELRVKHPNMPEADLKNLALGMTLKRSHGQEKARGGQGR
jgi:hypothetical protein